MPRSRRRDDPGVPRGRITRRNSDEPLAPRSDAASSRLSSIPLERHVDRQDHQRDGRE
jgi:hypothetical protein